MAVRATPGPATTRSAPRIGLVVATRDRHDSLLRTLSKLEALPESPPTVVVDNASSDGTAAIVAERYPEIDVVALRRNSGAAARNVGVERLDTPFVAFSDDDSWWRPGALGQAAEILSHYPGVGLLAARVLVGAERRLDPISKLMQGAARPGLPGPPIDGFLACAAIVRRDAFLAAGGFCERFLIGGEETLLAIDMSAAGWDLCYAGDVVAVHEPDATPRDGRRWRSARNSLWTAWMRHSVNEALGETAALARLATSDPEARRALISAAVGLPWALSSRREAKRG